MKCKKCGKEATHAFAEVKKPSFTSHWPVKHLLKKSDFKEYRETFTKFIPYCSKCILQPAITFLMINAFRNEVCVCDTCLKEVERIKKINAKL